MGQGWGLVVADVGSWLAQCLCWQCQGNLKGQGQSRRNPEKTDIKTECRSVFIQEKASIQRRWPQGEWMPYRRWLEFWLTPESSGGHRTGESAECKMPRVDQVWYCTPVILRDEVGKNTSSRPSWATQQESISKKTNTNIQECSVPWWKLTAHQKTWSQYKVVPKRCCLIPVSKTRAPQGCMSFCCFLYRIAVMPLSVPKLKTEWHTTPIREFPWEASVYICIECLPAFKSDTPRARISASVHSSVSLALHESIFPSLWAQIIGTPLGWNRSQNHSVSNRALPRQFMPFDNQSHWAVADGAVGKWD